MPKIVIIKYNAGNVQSVIYALNRLGIEPTLSDEIEVIQSADKIIFPGVGEASSAMSYLKEKKLDKIIPELKQPFLGICLGLQLMCAYSEENDTPCLGIFPMRVKKFPAGDKVPQMGWNTIYDLNGRLFRGLKNKSYMYFVHSYYAELSELYTVSKTMYIVEYSSSIQKNNFLAVQFHAEKSSEAGAVILKNFLEM